MNISILKFVLIPLIIWVLSQSVKFIAHTIKSGSVSKEAVYWIYQWAGGAPSTHAAMLTSSLYLLGIYNGLDAIFGFAFVVALILMYNLLAEKKKQELFDKHLRKTKDGSLKTVIKDSRLLDISGHTLFEIFYGVIFGLISAIILLKII